MSWSAARADVPTVAYPPGPPRSFRTLVIYGPGRDPLAFFGNLARTYGDVSHVHMSGEHLFLFNHPQLIKDVLATNQRNFLKGRGLERARRLIGRPLLTSEGALHLTQRRLMQPAFHRDRIASYASVMTGHADRVQRSWHDGATIDAAQEMNRLTLGIVGKTLFDADVDAQAKSVGTALSAVMSSFWMTMLPFFDVMEHLPLPVFRRSRQGRAELDAIIYGMIAERRRHPSDRGDLLSMLLMAQDEEGDGGGMTDEQVRDEAMTIFLAGHETTANALAWTWYLLSGAPDVEARLHEEVDRVLGGRLPTVEDLPNLPYARKVLNEAMRLYPPAWIMNRQVVEEHEVGGHTLPVGAVVLIFPYQIQRDPRFWTEPDRFDPDRWTPEADAKREMYAYIPFGAGPRMCIGEAFAWMEAHVVLATLAQRWRPRPKPGHVVKTEPKVNLRPKGGLPMVLEARA